MTSEQAYVLVVDKLLELQESIPGIRFRASQPVSEERKKRFKGPGRIPAWLWKRIEFHDLTPEQMVVVIETGEHLSGLGIDFDKDHSARVAMRHLDWSFFYRYHEKTYATSS